MKVAPSLFLTQSLLRQWTMRKDEAKASAQAEEVTAMCAELRMTQDEFARRINLKPGTLYKLGSGWPVSDFTMEALRWMCRAIKAERGERVSGESSGYIMRDDLQPTGRKGAAAKLLDYVREWLNVDPSNDERTHWMLHELRTRYPIQGIKPEFLSADARSELERAGLSSAEARSTEEILDYAGNVTDSHVAAPRAPSSAAARPSVQTRQPTRGNG